MWPARKILHFCSPVSIEIVAGFGMEKTPPGLVETLGFGLKPPGSHLCQTRGDVYLYIQYNVFYQVRYLLYYNKTYEMHVVQITV